MTGSAARPPAPPRAPRLRLPHLGAPAGSLSSGELGRGAAGGSRRLLATEPRETKDRKDLLGHCPALCSTLLDCSLLRVLGFSGTRVQYGSSPYKDCLFLDLKSMFCVGFFFLIYLFFCFCFLFIFFFLPYEQ